MVKIHKAFTHHQKRHWDVLLTCSALRAFAKLEDAVVAIPRQGLGSGRKRAPCVTCWGEPGNHNHERDLGVTSSFAGKSTIEIVDDLPTTISVDFPLPHGWWLGATVHHIPSRFPSLPVDQPRGKKNQQLNKSSDIWRKETGQNESAWRLAHFTKNTWNHLYL